MADQRISATCTKSHDGSTILSHTVLYSVTSGSATRRFTVVVRATEMTNPHDMTELATKADAKASAVKAKWSASLASKPIIAADTGIAGTPSL